MKINLCLPTGEDVKADFMMSLSRMLMRGAKAGIEFQLTNVKTSNVAQSREQTAMGALKSDCSHLLWLDSDMVFPDWTLERLLMHDADIVAANYAMRGFLHPMPTAVVDIKSDGQCRRTYAAQGDQLIEVEGIGLGLMLMKRTVLERMAQPWFPIEWNSTGKFHDGEDIGFCTKARKAGFKIFVDPVLSRRLGHVGAYLYTLSATPLQYSEAKKICWDEQ